MEEPNIPAALLIISICLFFAASAFQSLTKGKFNAPMKVFHFLLIVLSLFDPSPGNQPMNNIDDNDSNGVRIISAFILVLGLVGAGLGIYLIAQ